MTITEIRDGYAHWQFPGLMWRCTNNPAVLDEYAAALTDLAARLRAAQAEPSDQMTIFDEVTP